jgi:hypothetical protein
MITPDFEFVIEESSKTADGVRVAGRLRSGKITAGGGPGWLQKRADMAVAVRVIDVEDPPGDASGRMVLVLRGCPVAEITAGAVLRSQAWIGRGGMAGEPGAGPVPR